ncbi:hypothetical protein PAUR_a1679 [Pseudoalteromonas aurantia 208]|uniref:Uncharacterized protein n=1 Tax=Pseudoalteromonas aurantia 208 TaxID=1314867 RepID=A0ABR9EAZ2_9GAMM|nr:hypothetical protein [Pseudoalteromonas aurantia 208]
MSDAFRYGHHFGALNVLNDFNLSALGIEVCSTLLNHDFFT